MFYAQADSFEYGKKEYGAGFANTLMPICFKKKSDRDQWLEDTYYTLAKPITRKDAIRMSCKATDVFGTREFYCIDGDLKDTDSSLPPCKWIKI